jgi:hypothetical protein
MEILRQNPVNLYNFVGLITVPSNQKVIKKLNKYDDVFDKVNKTDIDYMANEGTVMKYLQRSALLRYFRRLLKSFISYFTISTCKCGFLVVLVT